MTIDETRFAWVYSALVLVGLALLVLFPSAKAIPRPERWKYAVLQLVTLVFAIVGAKIALLAGDLGWPVRPLPGGFRQVVESGRSITGGLLGGFLAAEAAKPLLRYRAPPNDHFAAKLPFSIAVGRVGCLLGGCCRGVPHEGALSIVYSDGIPRFPAQLVELAFQIGAGLALVALLRRRVLGGRLFALYMIVYGAFRFATEPLRETPKLVAGSSVYQLLAVALVLAGAASMIARSRGAARPDPALEGAT